MEEKTYYIRRFDANADGYEMTNQEFHQAVGTPNEWIGPECLTIHSRYDAFTSITGEPSALMTLFSLLIESHNVMTLSLYRNDLLFAEYDRKEQVRIHYLREKKKIILQELRSDYTTKATFDIPWQPLPQRPVPQKGKENS